MKARSPRNLMRSVLLLLAAAILVAWHCFPPSVYKLSYLWLWLQLLLLVMIIFPRPLIGIGIWAGMIGALNYANIVKIELVQFPITHQDLMITVSNPTGFLDAIGMSRPRQLLLYILIFIVVGAALFYRRRRNPSDAQWYQLPAKALLAPTVAILAASAIFGKFYSDYGNHLSEHRREFLQTASGWHSDNPIHAIRKLSGVGFLAFSYGAALSDLENIKRFAARAPSENTSALENMADGFFLNSTPAAKQPNIVFILAESTFDPNAVFRLSKPVSNSLFERRTGEIGGLLHVTAVGGGTWKTEFETISGMDSRLFGFLGEYAHSALSPYIKKTFATYLKNRGYETGAFYSTEGNFFNARNAYKSYGFDRFEDARQLGLSVDWTKFSDEKMASVIVERFSSARDSPFFYYTTFLENHSPHVCHNFLQDGVRFAGRPLPEDQCQLNEYLRKLKSTEKGFEQIIAKLREVERNTGRPFIAVIFGDHQPNSFVTPAFDPYRTRLSKHETFYKIVKSSDIHIPEIEGPFHASLLPTLISSALVSDPRQVYMPESLYAQKKCGNAAPSRVCMRSDVLFAAYSVSMTF